MTDKHPDARLIAAAPNLLAERDRLAAENTKLRKDRERLEWCATWGAGFNWWDGKCVLHYVRESRDGNPGWADTNYHSDPRAAVDEAMAHAALDETQRITESDYSAADGGGDE